MDIKRVLETFPEFIISTLNYPMFSNALQVKLSKIN